MKLPFDLPSEHLPIIVPCPKVKSYTLVDDTIIYIARAIKFLPLKSDRDLFNIGSMLDILQFAKLNPTERYVILSLQRRLTFDKKVCYPGLEESGKLVYVEGSDGKSVWATITSGIIVTRRFTILDLCEEGMALDKPEVILETIETVQKGCPDARPDALLARFQRSKARQRTEISRALNTLVEFGILRELINLDGHQYRAVFNPRLVASSTSAIIRSVIRAEDHNGTIITFGTDLNPVEDPKKRSNVTTAGKRKKRNKQQYQSMYNSEQEKRRKAEKLIADYEGNGYMTQNQFTELCKAKDDPATSRHVREALDSVFETAHTDPLTEIPILTDTKKDISNA